MERNWSQIILEVSAYFLEFRGYIFRGSLVKWVECWKFQAISMIISFRGWNISISICILYKFIVHFLVGNFVFCTLYFGNIYRFLSCRLISSLELVFCTFRNIYRFLSCRFDFPFQFVDFDLYFYTFTLCFGNIRIVVKIELRICFMFPVEFVKILSVVFLAVPSHLWQHSSWQPFALEATEKWGNQFYAYIKKAKFSFVTPFRGKWKIFVSFLLSSRFRAFLNGGYRMFWSVRLQAQ